jgi:CBS domain containing-hemolysin-like protein
MQSLTVRDLMVPKGEYATISANDTLGDAALALQDAQLREQELDPNRHRDRALLVIDDRDRVIGKLSMLNVLQGLSPRYEKMRGFGASSKAAARHGSARSLIDSMEKDIGLWNKPLSNLVEKASTVTVRHLIREFVEGETVDAEAPLDRAVHQLIVGRFQSLLVTSNGDIVGILRLTDIYEEISKLLRAHNAAGQEDSTV